MKYEKWLREKLTRLREYADKTKLTRFQRSRVKHFQHVVSMLFAECRNPDEIAFYEDICEEYGFTKGQATGEEPFPLKKKPQKPRPRIVCVDEGSLAVIWTDGNGDFIPPPPPSWFQRDGGIYCR